MPAKPAASPALGVGSRQETRTLAGRVFPRRRLHQTLIFRSAGSPASRCKSELSAHPYRKLTAPFNENVQPSRSCFFNRILRVSVFNETHPTTGGERRHCPQASRARGAGTQAAPPAVPPRTTLCPLRSGLATLAPAPHALPSHGYLRHRGAHCGGATQRSVPTTGEGRAGQSRAPAGAAPPTVRAGRCRTGFPAGRDGRAWGRGAGDPALQNGAAPDPLPLPSRGIPEPRTSRPWHGTARRGAVLPPPPPRPPPGGSRPAPQCRGLPRHLIVAVAARARSPHRPPAPTVPPSPRTGAGVPGIYGPAAPAPACLLQYGRLRAAAAAVPRRARPRQVGEPCRAGAAAG